MTAPAADPADDSRPSASTRRGSRVWLTKLSMNGRHAEASQATLDSGIIGHGTMVLPRFRSIAPTMPFPEVRWSWSQ